MHLERVRKNWSAHEQIIKKKSAIKTRKHNIRNGCLSAAMFRHNAQNVRSENAFPGDRHVKNTDRHVQTRVRIYRNASYPPKRFVSYLLKADFRNVSPFRKCTADYSQNCKHVSSQIQSKFYHSNRKKKPTRTFLQHLDFSPKSLRIITAFDSYE